MSMMASPKLSNWVQWWIYPLVLPLICVSNWIRKGWLGYMEFQKRRGGEWAVAYHNHSGRLSREKIFTNFTVWEPHMKVSPRNVDMPHLPKWSSYIAFQHFRCKMLTSYWSTKFFSFECFPLYGIRSKQGDIMVLPVVERLAHSWSIVQNLILIIIIFYPADS